MVTWYVYKGIGKEGWFDAYMDIVKYLEKPDRDCWSWPVDKTLWYREYGSLRGYHG